MVIELFPDHKIGLTLASGVLIAAGFGGYGSAYRSLVDLAYFGAVITRPITLRPRRFKPLVTELSQGFLLEDAIPEFAEGALLLAHSDLLWLTELLGSPNHRPVPRSAPAVRLPHCVLVTLTQIPILDNAMCQRHVKEGCCLRVTSSLTVSEPNHAPIGLLIAKYLPGFEIFHSRRLCE